MTVDVVHSIREVRERVAAARASGRSVAFVPTMGALHSGHLSLVERAASLGDLVVVSIFVNPLQFAAGEDLERYPRTLEADVSKLEATADALVFAPSVDEMYPAGPSATRVAAGPVGSRFEGAVRPGHFDGTLTVVAKLFAIVQPDVAVFGQKDAQQAFLVRQMVADLNLPLRIEVAPTVREEGGLALSSRNQYLDAEQTSAALVLSRALEAVADTAAGWRGRAPSEAITAGREVLEAEPRASVDYLDIVDPATFRPVPDEFTGEALAIVAARIGTTRLIDNRTVLFAAPAAC
ncbi:pantoate--beta-alanine ligase [Salinibacterium sp. SYSU T00001]|uniref:pantoate--beta-alanine ligase n=1 Tax=Homoserinimonas sedimenticola TaxID=2986805 RepID=UPI002235ED55|nr:pantoate--beta-alanine ligase [Salinibacterium sedimenticola]MCW4385400.1 pantoate--beta-alanine ligase [Salinibacterium sedimenticola]